MNENSKIPRRTIGSLLSPDGTVEFKDEEQKQTEKERHNNNNNQRNPLARYYYDNQDLVYDRKDMLKTLVKEDGLLIAIEELKEWKKNKAKRPFYMNLATKDIIFASAIRDALTEVFGKDKLYESSAYDVSKKDISLILDELLYFLEHHSRDQRLIKKYGEDALENMVNEYTTILYKFSKKKVKKLKEIKGMPEKMAKQIVVITASKNVSSSIYSLMNYLYSEINKESFSITNKNIIKLFKVCYGKNSLNEVIKYLLLERTSTLSRLSTKAQDFWYRVDEIVRNELEKMPKKEVKSIIEFYISERKRQEKQGKMPRRLGNRKTLNPDDYPNLTKIFESIEKDFSIREYLR